MSVLQIPPPDAKPWPTLGPQLWDWMLDSLVYGPGDLRGVPLAEHPPDEEFRGLLYRMYEVYPHGHERAGRRRFRRCALSLRKGTGKTEKAAWIAAAELHPEAPVRCEGFKRVGSRWDPVGVGVRDPYLPMVAYTAEQVEDLAYPSQAPRLRRPCGRARCVYRQCGRSRGQPGEAACEQTSRQGSLSTHLRMA